MRFEIDRARGLYASADLGIALLPPASARCVGAARLLYSGILDDIERRDYDVFARARPHPDLAEAYVVARSPLGAS